LALSVPRRVAAGVRGLLALCRNATKIARHERKQP
jgi:hypothetical protein